MRKLLIVDPSLLSLAGHSYNYDLAIYEAACKRFYRVVVYADRGFRDASGRMRDLRPVLNRLRMDRLKGLVNWVFHRLRPRPRHDASPTRPHATVVPGVWPWVIRAAKWLRARDLAGSLRRILREEQRTGDEVHVFFQHAHFSELMLAAGSQGPANLHLVLRYSPDLVNAGQVEPAAFARTLRGLGRHVHLYTDSERLSAEYRALGASDVRTLPVPILLPDDIRADEGEQDPIRVAFLGAARVEKGYCELPRIIAGFPAKAAGRRLVTMVQGGAGSLDPRVQRATDELCALAERLPPGAIELLPDEVPLQTYYGWFARASIVAMPYVSAKYNASTSGIFVEALCFGIPVVCPANSWMADVIEEARTEKGLVIGIAAPALEDFPSAIGAVSAELPRYRGAVREFARHWRAVHNADACVEVLLGAAGR